MVSHIKQEDTQDTIYTFDVRDYCRVNGLEVDTGYYYATLKSDIMAIDSQVMIMESPINKGEYIRLRWLNVLRLNEAEGYIKYNFAQDIRPYIFELKNHFTRYKVKYAMCISGRYGKKMYELLKSYQHLTKEIYFELDKLKFLLDAEHYDRYPDFRRNVLEPSIRDINKYTDIYVKYEKDIPEGQRAVKGINFIIIPIFNQEKIEERTENLEEKLGYYDE
jgi:plasmid replication initiation protein